MTAHGARAQQADRRACDLVADHVVTVESPRQVCCSRELGAAGMPRSSEKMRPSVISCGRDAVSPRHVR